MKPKQEDSQGAIVEECARRLLETVPLVMRLIRQEMRGVASETLSVPQFRTLLFLGRHRGASLSSVARHLGVAAATASAMVERLVQRKLVSRAIHPEERRRVILELTPEGTGLMEQSRARARAFMTANLARWETPHLKQLCESLELLNQALGPQGHKQERP